MKRSYLAMSLVASFCLVFASACSDSASSTGGEGGSGGIGGEGGMGGSSDCTTQEKVFDLGCANSSPVGLQSILNANLKVCAPTIAASSDFEATVSGNSGFPESFLDAAQALLMGGLKQAKLVDLQYVVQVRNGATLKDPIGDAPGVALTADVDQLDPGSIRLCNFPADQECTEGSECQGTICNEPVVLVDVPTSDDCAPGGVCDLAGKADGSQSQCALNGFCVTGGIDVPLLPVTATYTAEASGDVLFGWADEGLDNNTFDAMTNLFTIPKPLPIPPVEQGLAVDAGLTVFIECVMGTDEGEEPGNEENDLVGLTPDEDLISFPIVE